MALAVLTILAIAGVAIRSRPSPPSRPILPPGISQRLYDAGANAFREHYHREPDHFDVLSWLGEALVEEDQIAAAVVCLEGIPPDHPRYGHLARFQQAYHFAKLNRARQSEAKLREFIQLERESPHLTVQHYVSALRLLRFLLEVELRFEERQEVLREVHDLGYAGTFETVAYCFPSILRWNGPTAIAWHEGFWKQDPDDFRLRVALGRYHTGAGSLDEARSVLEKCCAEQPHSLPAHAAYLAILHEQGDWEIIAAVLDRLPPINQSEPWLLTRMRGHFRNHRGEHAKAVRCFLAAVESDPANAESYLGLAMAYRALGREEEQKEALRRSSVLARMGNRLAWVLFHEDEIEPMIEIANLCVEVGLYDSARHMAKLIQKTDPKHEGGQQLVARLDEMGDPEEISSPFRDSTLADATPVAKQDMAASSPAADVPVAANVGEVLTASSAPHGILPHFEEISTAVGISFERYDDMRRQHRIIESNGGGVGLFDYDGDGWLDIFFTDGCRVPKEGTTGENSNQLYRNLGNGQFALATDQAGVRWEGFCHGCAVGDYDGDGFEDLYVTAFGRNRFWRNNGDGTFSDFTDVTGTDVELWNSSAAFADLNRDGNLDLYVVSYVVEDPKAPRLCPEKNSPDGYTCCPPTMYPAADDVLFISDGRGGFENRGRGTGINGVDGKGLGIVVFDMNQDGWPDIYVGNDATPNFLYMNQTGQDEAPSSESAAGTLLPRFDERAMLMGAAVNGMGGAEASMGIGYGDYDADGWIDLFLTHFYMGTNTLYRNIDGHMFDDISSQSHLAAPSRQKLSWGVKFVDFENDGWLDLFIASGHVDDWRWRAGNPPYAMNPQVFLNRRSGGFDEVTTWAGDYFQQLWLGRGVATGDLDHDGDIDVVVSHQLSPSVVLRNDTDTAYGSVIVKLIGRDRSNRSAVNARVEAEGLDLKIVREVVGGGSYQSACDRSVHVGLGDRQTVEVLRIIWPSGNVEEWKNVTPGSYIAVEQQGLYPHANW